jgi:ubiquinone/menaquinone biosynthesis C-methylase UbiE
VFGVEPNAEMRKAGEEFLNAYPRFSTIEGTAEETTLPDHTVDLVTAAQAAHWFDRRKARHEFIRILKPGGWSVLIWNERRIDSTPFLRDFEQLLLRYGTDYETVRHERTTEEIENFFAPSPFQLRTFDHLQEFDYPALEGRLLSSSYTPQSNDVAYKPMMQELRQIFDARQENGQVAFEYNTLVYYGQVT